MDPIARTSKRTRRKRRQTIPDQEAANQTGHPTRTSSRTVRTAIRRSGVGACSCFHRFTSLDIHAHLCTVASVDHSLLPHTLTLYKDEIGRISVAVCRSRCVRFLIAAWTAPLISCKRPVLPKPDLGAASGSGAFAISGAWQASFWNVPSSAASSESNREAQLVLYSKGCKCQLRTLIFLGSDYCAFA